ncbi:MAG: flagellar hook-basal body complex protein FliE [Acidobacteriota bacterium]|nr:flagellar hook-basal body complex protein FliE [Acidobacteriota bacterium]
MDPLNLSQILPPSPVSSPAQTGAGGVTGGAQGDVGFGDLLKQALQEVNQAQTQADGEARNLMTGESADMHTAMLAVQKADLSFQMMMAVRSKLIDAYREVMRMQM